MSVRFADWSNSNGYPTRLIFAVELAGNEKAKKLLMVNAVELLAAEKVLQEKKKEAHKAKTKLEKTNATLLADSKTLEKHRELQGAEPKFIRRWNTI